LTHLTTGAVFKPEPSFDGSKVLFAMRRDDEDWFHLYEVQVDGNGLRQLTDGPFNDFGGVYLPDDRIVFCSDRTGYLEEYHEERTETLFTMNPDGSGIQQITFLPGTYFEPSVLADGRILFSYWDPFHIDVPPFDKHETYLATVHPDGAEERHLFGAGQYGFFGRERHSGVGLTQARELPDGRILCQSEMGPAVIDLKAGLPMLDALTPIWPGVTSVQLGGTTHRVHLSPLGTRSTAYPLADGRILLSATAPGARDSAIYMSDPDTRQERLVINLPNHAEFDAVPVLTSRPRPALLPRKVDPKSQTTRFLVVAGRTADNPQRQKALQQARYFRVVEAEYSGVTTSSHTNLETRILGVVPILPDGSAYFEAPADTPIFLDPLDAAGNRVLMEWGYPHTSVQEGAHYPATQMAYMSGRPGEVRSCYGCHATQTDAVPNVPVEAVKRGPVKITRKATDIEYRRNDPEGYRRQARLGESSRYRPWLTSKNPVQRARACEMLMYLEDEAPAPASFIALLRDPEIEVRRAAALALTCLGTHEEHKAMIEAARQETDWQVRFHLDSAMASAGCADDQSTNWERIGRQKPEPSLLARVRAEVARPIPDVLALRAAGKLHDAEAIPLLTPWLKKHVWEYHAAEAAVALGRIGTPTAVNALWEAVRTEVPIKQVHISRYLQHGPRPEEYALLRGLVLANARTEVRDVHVLLALLPNTFMEKPRFEDRMRAESQRVLLPRLLLERSGHRQPLVAILWAALCGEQKAGPLYQQLLKGINLERPFSEHGRPFNVVTKVGAEEALWLLGCLLDPGADLGVVMRRDELEARVAPYLKSTNHRERIDAAVLLGRTGFGPKTAQMLGWEASRPYVFPEISSMGKGMPDPNFRDKAYLVLNLARHIEDVEELRPFADPLTRTRDVRYGLTHGLAFRGKPDAIPLLQEMATRDPITLIRQQARNALADIQDMCRLEGQPVPPVALPENQPLEAGHAPRGLHWPEVRPPEAPRMCQPAPKEEPALVRACADCLKPEYFRNLNNAQASGASHLMTAHVEETRLVFAALALQHGEASRKALLAALDSPYPHAHYLAARAIADRGDRAAIPVLLAKFDGALKAQDPVGFWAICDALARLQAREAMPILARHAVPANPSWAFGPEGMATGYIVSATLARIAADARQADVARLLQSPNPWLRAGALRGLAEARAPGIEELARKALDEANPALVRQEARVQLAALRKSSP
jgi:HEAT repeat protein